MIERQVMLAEYAESAIQIEEFVGTLSNSVLARRNSPSEWCAREIVHHLADVEVGDAMRLRQMLAHDSPLIVSYDEERFAARLHYDRPLSSSLAVFTILRTSNTELLERLSDADWSRSGRHEEHDLYTIEILARKSIEHDRQHLAQIRRASASASQFR